MQKLTGQALEVIDSFEGDILNVKETLSHDGYDSLGPESNLWDLYIVDSNSKTHHYHREYWFQGFDNDKYQIVD